MQRGTGAIAPSLKADELPRSAFPRNRGFYIVRLQRAQKYYIVSSSRERKREHAIHPENVPTPWCFFLFRGAIVKGFMKPGKRGRARNRTNDWRLVSMTKFLRQLIRMR